MAASMLRRAGSGPGSGAGSTAGSMAAESDSRASSVANPTAVRPSRCPVAWFPAWESSIASSAPVKAKG